MNQEYKELYELVQKAGLLGSIGSLLSWDREVLAFPKGNMNQRIKETTLITELVHEAAINPRIGELCSELSSQELSQEQEDFVREVLFDFTRSSKIPAELATRMSKKSIEASEVWAEARKTNNFDLFAPHLQEMIDLQKEYAQTIDPTRSTYEVLFEDYESGMTLDEVNKIFSDLKAFLIPFVQKIKEATPIEPLPLFDINTQEQLAFNKKMAAHIGYNFNKGMLAESVHPFTGYFGRMTTRFSEGWVDALTGTLHEAGHGMYEQNLPEEHAGTPLSQARSLSVHESQSRFWENNIGRSRAFASWLFPQLQQTYGNELANMSEEEYYKRLNKVRPSYIRVSADEVTYSLHILLRFELEQELFAGEVEVQDLPTIWNQKMETYLGITPENDTTGVLQDVHWSYGLFSYFPTYSLGTMLAAQLHEAMKKDLPIEDLVRKGEFAPIKDWLVKRIHVHGRRYSTQDLIKKATGKELSVDAYKKYLEAKYTDICNL